jgi:predicted TIM-barrel fold metal-dependent hydrolase
MDRVWATLAEAGATAVLHFGTTGRGLGPAWHGDHDLPGVADPLDVLLAHHGAEAYLGRLALSGVLHRHPDLRLVVAEHGAAWLPGFLRNLDAVHAAFAGLPLGLPPAPPAGELLSEVVRRHVAVVPTVLDDVAALTSALGPGVLAFGSDFPHPEGGPEPVAHATTGLSAHDAAALLAGTAQRVLPPG